MGWDRRKEMELSYEQSVDQLFDDLGEECPVGEDFVRAVAAYKVGATCHDFADFKQKAKRLGVFKELFRVN
jgi:hypothetical protein